MRRLLSNHRGEPKGSDIIGTLLAGGRRLEREGRGFLTGGLEIFTYSLETSTRGELFWRQSKSVAGEKACSQVLVNFPVPLVQRPTGGSHS